jgi:acyl dehydratase
MHEGALSAHEKRRPRMTSFVALAAGHRLPILRYGPYTSSMLVKWAAAQQNWDRIHYDQQYCRDFAGLPAPVIHGGMKQHLLIRYLSEALGGLGWVRGLTIRYLGPDFVGETLELSATVEVLHGETTGGGQIVSLAIEGRNCQQNKVSTAARAVVCTGQNLASRDAAVVAGIDQYLAPDSTQSPPCPAVSDRINALIGTRHEAMASVVPVDRSRLRLFADALGGVDPMHYDPAAGLASPHGEVVAPPLFPLHALESAPGTWPLSTDPEAMGREGVSEIGRNLARDHGFSNAGMVNGGSSFEIHDLARLGETISAQSVLMSVEHKQSRSGPMLLTVALNSYATSSGRLLLREQQTTIYRNFQPVPEES